MNQPGVSVANQPKTLSTNNTPGVHYGPSTEARKTTILLNSYLPDLLIILRRLLDQKY